MRAERRRTSASADSAGFAFDVSGVPAEPGGRAAAGGAAVPVWRGARRAGLGRAPATCTLFYGPPGPMRP